MKTNQRSFLSVFVLVCTLVVGCNNPVLHNRPSDRACIQWLHGQKIVWEKGIVFDSVWTISSNTFTAFNLESVSNNSDGTATATVQFELKDGERSLRVDGQIVYRHHKADDVIEFISFTPTRLLKLGKW